jgi:cytochrome c biogenesis protein CcmG, thiol:disulfide interchange protein DsbE
MTVWSACAKIGAVCDLSAMKSMVLLLPMLLIGFISEAQIAKKNWDLPAVNVKTLEGKTFSTGDLDNGGRPIIVSFWATWCKPCVLELSTIAELYADWQEETGVKLVAISIDDARNVSKVPPFVNGKDWDYEVYLDPNADFKRAMNVNTVPHTFLLNGQGQVVFQHNAYAPGDEHHLYSKVKELVGK